METLTAGMRGVSLLVKINWDRLLYSGLIILALWAGASLGKILFL